MNWLIYGALFVVLMGCASFQDSAPAGYEDRSRFATWFRCSGPERGFTCEGF